jgi:ribosomal protein S12 methylthiotransferase
MTGFPGETEEDFKTLLNFISEIRFDHLGAFVYSDSDDLPAHRLSQAIPRRTAQKRYRELMARQMRIALEINAAHIGKTLNVLVEEMPEQGLFTGRTAFQAPEVDGITYVRANNLAVGEFAAVRITDALEYDLIGECL